MEASAFLVAGLIAALIAVFTVVRAVRIVPQARAVMSSDSAATTGP